MHLRERVGVITARPSTFSSTVASVYPATASRLEFNRFITALGSGCDEISENTDVYDCENGPWKTEDGTEDAVEGCLKWPRIGCRVSCVSGAGVGAGGAGGGGGGIGTESSLSVRDSEDTISSG